jgi:hypothetical protein
MIVKRINSLLTVLFILLFFPVQNEANFSMESNVPRTFASHDSLTGAVFYVSPKGNDNNPGTRNLPYQSLDAARDAARNAGAELKKIVILPGTWFLSETFELNSKDNGLIIEAEVPGTVSIYGGQEIGNWQPGDDGFWYADLPEVKEGAWDFRALVVNGTLAERARFPQSGTFLHKQVWDVKMLPAIAGYWQRQPFPEEKIIMAYNPEDIPETLDIKNAEIRVYHMWDESMVGVAHNNTNEHVFTFTKPATYPPGAFGIMKYVIFNTREGMTHPGQWYLDRTAGRLVYWPAKELDMKSATIIAPRIEKVIEIAGTKESPVDHIALRGISIQVTTIPLKPAGWAGGSFEGALSIRFAEHCEFENLEIFNTAGLGISADQVNNSKITNCIVRHTGACGFKFSGSKTVISENRIHDVGIFFPGSGALYVHGENMHIYRNQIYNGPYSGMILYGSNNLIEENHISRVMQEMHDGAAIYSSGTSVHNSVLRGNLVSDIVAVGHGFGVSSYYFDEGAENCLVENNVSIGVARPTHNHIVSAITYRNNTFITDGDMTLSFQRSADCNFENNTLVAPGKINIVQPNGIKTWNNNVVFRDRNSTGQSMEFTIDPAMPPFKIPERMNHSAVAVKVSKAPVLDGEIGLEEWPGEFHTLDREPSRLPASGAPTLVKLAYDKEYLYIGTIVTMFDPGKIIKGDVWGENDGLELAIAGKTPDGKPADFVIRLFAGNILQCPGIGRTTNKINRQLEKEIRFSSVVKPKQRSGGGWYSEMAVPLHLLGIKAEPGLEVAFNLSSWCNEYGNWHCWEGTQGNSWDLEQAGLLRFD